MKKTLGTFLGLSGIILFAAISFLITVKRETFNINIIIDVKKPRTVNGQEIPSSYTYPIGAKGSPALGYKAFYNPINTQMISTYNDDNYGPPTDVSIERGS